MKNMKLRRNGIVLLMAMMVCFIGLMSFSKEAEAAKKSKPYKVKGTTITVKAKKKSDITEKLDAALKAARDKASDKKQYTVVVPKGTYYINQKGLHIFSNTTLDLSKGVTLKYKSKKSHPMLATGVSGKYKGVKNYNTSSKCKGYKGFRNITIKGGKFASTSSNTSSTMRIFHATNITLEGVTFSNGGGVHQLEVAAIDKFYVRNCTFKDYGKNYKGSSNRKLEALQMDNPCSKAVYPDTYEDGTVMKNVEITGCTFSNVPRGVGSHTLLNGAYNTNIKINNNTFKNLSEEAIVALNYQNCEIKDNKISNCGGGVLVQFFKPTPESISTTVKDGKKAYKGTIQHDANTVISGNTITTKYNKKCDEIQGIKVYGLNFTASKKGRDGKKIPKGNYYISNVTVENNTITTAGYGIHMMDTRDCVVKNNTITESNVSSSDKNKAKYDGVLVENYAQNTSVSENTIKSMKRHGIFVQQSAKLTTIDHNTISGCARSGISFFAKSGASIVTENKISSCKENGIILNENCSVGTISNNKIACKNESAGIYVYNKSTITGSILSNEISGTNRAGIMIQGNSQVSKDIKDNTISNTSRGMYILESSKVLGTISENTMTDVGVSYKVDANSKANVPD